MTSTRCAARLAQANPVFARVGLARFGANDQTGPGGEGVPPAPDDAAFLETVTDYYQTNPISRASLTMAECSRIAPASLAAAPLAVAAE